MTSPRLHHWRDTARRQWPGLSLCAVVALAATFVSEHYGGPQLLYALLIGLALNFLATDTRIRPGLDLCSRTLLRAGVALLGLRITAHQVVALGWQTALLAVVALFSTVAVGLWLAKWLRRPDDEGLIAGAAVGICGASAALAVASVLPPTKENERFTLLTVMGITLLSTTAMVLYPLLARWTGLTPLQAGVFFGASIHDVAQVVAAGTLLSHAGEVAAADSAVIVKLFRVMLLMPVVLTVALAVSRRQVRDKTNADTDTNLQNEAGPAVPLIPGFLLVFIVFMLANSSGWVPASLTAEGSQWSRHLLVVAIAAVGIKTQPADLLKLGWPPVAMLLAETVWIAGLALAAVHWI
jgi:uncharacterized integral membrane protein (TIGR00698 family)